MLGWFYIVAVLLGVVAICYLDRGSAGRGHLELGEQTARDSDDRTAVPQPIS